MTEHVTESNEFKQRLSKLEERLEVYESIDKKLAKHSVDTLSCFRAYLAIFSIIITVFGLGLAALGIYGTFSVLQARDLMKSVEADRKMAEETLKNIQNELADTEAKNKMAEENMQIIQTKLRDTEKALANTRQKVQNIQLNVSLEKEGSGVLLAGYDVVLLNKALMKKLEEKGLLTEAETRDIEEKSVPANADDFTKQRGVITMEGVAVSGHPPMTDKLE